MKSVKLFFTLAVLFFIGLTTSAQDKEVGIFLGTTEYHGDLSTNIIHLNEIRPGVGVLGRYYLSPRFDIDAGANLGWLAGSDNNDKTNHDRLKRNLSFNSVLVELHGTFEYNILPYISNSQKYRFSPVLFVGISAFYFNPTDTFNGKTYDLHNYSTEGEGLPGGPPQYSLFQVAIPLGVAVKYSLGNFWNLGLEAGVRKTFTDYLDDVSGTYYNYDVLKSKKGIIADELAIKVNREGANPGLYNGVQRGNPNQDDSYYFVGFTLTKTLRRYSCSGI